MATATLTLAFLATLLEGVVMDATAVDLIRAGTMRADLYRRVDVGTAMDAKLATDPAVQHLYNDDWAVHFEPFAERFSRYAEVIVDDEASTEGLDLEVVKPLRNTMRGMDKASREAMKRYFTNLPLFWAKLNMKPSRIFVL